MKYMIQKAACVCLALMAVLGMLVGCGKEPMTGIWESAQYTADKTFGKGEKTLYVKVEAEEQTVTFTVKTDKETVGEALQEHGLIEGEEGPYGLYIKKVNGMTADYDIDQTYWAFNKGGAYVSSAVDKTPFADGEAFELVRTK